MAASAAAHNVKLSKTLSFLLRHGAVEAGLPMRSDGYVPLQAVLALPKLKGYNRQQVHEVVRDNNKQRFSIMEEGGVEFIRANQGHTIKTIAESEIFEEIKDAASVPVCVHGTYNRFWPSIKQQGLKTMKRTHIHFAVGLPGEDGVISGMRSSAEVLIFVDVAGAMADGMRFFRSQNNVILTSGFGGVVPPKYFGKIIHNDSAAATESLYRPSPSTAMSSTPRSQPFSVLAVLDFEATCDEPRPSTPPEVIEFPTVLISTATGETLGEFRSHVRPVLAPTISAFCTSLTGITQAQVANAPLFPEVLAQHEAWLRSKGLLGNHPPSFAFVTCGDWDLKTMMPTQCSNSKIPIPSHFRSWINLKILYSRAMNTKRREDMVGMLQGLGLPLKGKHHCGIDDCRNIAEVVKALLRKGTVFEFTTA